MKLFSKKEKKTEKDFVHKGTHHIDSNREIGVVAYMFIALFLMMLIYLGYFTQAGSKNIINNTYNKRCYSNQGL